MNHQITYQLQDIFNLLPNLTNPDFVKSVNVNTNDQMLVVYTASLIRSIIALHNLINNKLSNKEAERKESDKKADKKKEEDKDKVSRHKMYCTGGFVRCFFESPLLALAAWHRAAGLVHQPNSQKTVYKTYSTGYFVT